MGLGQKLAKGINTLGRKAENSVNKLGQKTDMVFKKVSGGINRVDNTVGDFIDKSADMAQTAVTKSGAVTNALRQGAVVGNAIVTNLNRAGLKDVPLIGTAAGLAQTGTNMLANGAKRLDSKRDQLAQQIENTRASAQMEKSNLTKRLDNENNNAHQKLSFV